MGKQKPRFSFRLPWSQAPRPAAVIRSPTSVTETKKTILSGSETQSSIQPISNPTSPAQRPPFRPTGVAPAQPSPRQAQTSPKRNSQSTQFPTPTTTQTTLETQSPGQLTAAASTPTIQSEIERKIPSKTSTNSTSITTIPDKMPPSSPPRKAEAQNPPPQAQASRKTESQPSSPSRAGIHPLILSEPLSPPRASSVSQATSHPSPPFQSLPRSQATSQPQSPSLVSSQSQAASHPPSRARPKPPKFSQAIHEPNTAVESLTATNAQPGAGTTAQTSSPKRVINSIERSQPTPSSNNSRPPISQEQNQTMSPPKSLDAAIQPTAAAAQPLEHSGPIVAKEIPSAKKKPDNNYDGFNPKPPTNSMETEIWKESENTTTVVYDASYSLAHTKENPLIEVQTEEKQLQNQPRLPKKQELNEKTSIKGRRTKTMILHPKDTSMVSESQQKPTTSNGGHFSLQEGIRNDISRLAHKMTVAHPEQPQDEKWVSVITLIGENQGTSMRLGSEATKRESEVHIHRGYKMDPNESAKSTSDDEEESSRRIMTKGANTKEDEVTKAYLNSNSQSINNSMLINCSITERNPGVHLTLSGQPPEPIKSNDKSESLEACKAEVNTTPSHKLIYNPTIRRRCLGGLFMEPTDSDPDNPEKPRRHGCRYSCRDKNKDKDVDVA